LVIAGARNHLPANRPLEFSFETASWRLPCGPTVAVRSGSRSWAASDRQEPIQCIRLATSGPSCWSA